MTKIKFLTFSITFFSLIILLGIFSISQVKAASYYQRGVLQSNNVLSGASITDITDFRITAQVPASTTVSISFSQDKSLYYNASGTKGAWTDVATGTNIIDMSDLAWSGALLFYKLKLTTSDASSTPTVEEIRVNYDGTAVPSATSTRYNARGILFSENILAGTSANEITGFQATTTIASGTFIRVSFSQDNSIFYSATGTKGAWTDLSDGGNNIDLTGLSWSGSSLYYKLRLEALDQMLQPKVSEVRAVYTGAEATASSSDYNWAGAFVSSDLMASTSGYSFFFDLFGYTVSYLPFGSTLKAQFSPDGNNWYSSTGTPWTYDSLTSGSHILPGSAISLADLGWSATSSFYFKLKFDLGSDNSYSPVIEDIRLYYYLPPNATLRGNVQFRGDVIIK